MESNEAVMHIHCTGQFTGMVSYKYSFVRNLHHALVTCVKFAVKYAQFTSQVTRHVSAVECALQVSKVAIKHEGRPTVLIINCLLGTLARQNELQIHDLPLGSRMINVDTL